MQHRAEKTSWVSIGRRLGLTIAFLGVSFTQADAMPLDAGALERNGAAAVFVQVQHRPGYHKGQEHRREMRHYRNDPGARYTLRNKRRVFCRRSPQYC